LTDHDRSVSTDVPSSVGAPNHGSASRPSSRQSSRPSWSAWVDQACGVVEAAGQWRRPRSFDARGPSGRLESGADPRPPSDVVSFASNDYLGLSSHPVVVDAAHLALDRWGAGAGASRLVTGSRPVHGALEVALAEWKHCERAVVFPTGFAANLSVLSVFGSEGAHVFSDEWNHASIIDGCRLARARVSVYPHGDLGRLDAALATSDGRAVVVTDTVFSMDGDHADLEGLVELARRHRALLVLDEAHAVLGPELAGPHGGETASGGRPGRDLPAAPDPWGVDVLRVGTLSKTLGSLGGFVAGPARFVELLVNRARPYIFTTAPTPADAAAALAAVAIVRSEEGNRLRTRLAGHVERVARVVGSVGHPSPIVPVVIGDEGDAVAASATLLDLGLWVPAIRPPTVPPGTSRLRVTLSAAHTDEQVDRLVDGLGALVSLGAVLGSHAS
jgi:8-amino-7-oxononanoate synthase